MVDEKQPGFQPSMLDTLDAIEKKRVHFDWKSFKSEVLSSETIEKIAGISGTVSMQGEPLTPKHLIEAAEVVKSYGIAKEMLSVVHDSVMFEPKPIVHAPPPLLVPDGFVLVDTKKLSTEQLNLLLSWKPALVPQAAPLYVLDPALNETSVVPTCNVCSHIFQNIHDQLQHGPLCKKWLCIICKKKFATGSKKEKKLLGEKPVCASCLLVNPHLAYKIKSAPPGTAYYEDNGPASAPPNTYADDVF